PFEALGNIICRAIQTTAHVRPAMAFRMPRILKFQTLNINCFACYIVNQTVACARTSCKNCVKVRKYLKKRKADSEFVKEYNIKRHYQIKHSHFDKFDGDEHTEKANELLSKVTAQQQLLIQGGSIRQRNVTEASYEVSKLIADGEFVKKCLTAVAKKLFQPTINCTISYWPSPLKKDVHTGEDVEASDEESNSDVVVSNTSRRNRDDTLYNTTAPEGIEFIKKLIIQYCSPELSRQRYTGIN
ncbi:hypothetical protein L9F63_018664, partial [Diploptera punctata]